MRCRCFLPAAPLLIVTSIRRSEGTHLERSFAVGPWHIDPVGNTFTRDARTVRVEPKAVWVLLTLARRAGEIVTRVELYDEVWQGRPVTDEVLSRCISLLRNTLDDDPRSPTYIQTVPRVGYRLVAPVTWPQAGEVAAPPARAVSGAVAAVPPAPPPIAGPSRAGRPGRRWWMGGIALALIVGVVGLATRDRLSGDAPASTFVAVSEGPRDGIAVMPFENLAVPEGSDYFSDGLTDELITSLSRVPGLKVIARTTSFAMKGEAGDVRMVGRRLGVSKVVSGTVRMDGPRLRISAQLVDAVGGYELWSRVYDARLEDVFDVQTSIAGAIVEAVIPRLEAQAAQAMSSGGPSTRNSEAHMLYLRALHVLKRREAEAIRHAIELLERAIRLDGTYAAAYVELARAYALLPFYSAESQAAMFARAQAVLANGLEHGARIGDAAQGLLAFMAFCDWDWLAAEDSFRKAFAYNPNDPELHQWYSQALASLGHAEASVKFAQRALELDTLSPVVNDRLAVAYLWTDQDERAARQFAEAALLGLGPEANEGAQVILLLRQRRYDAAGDMIRALQARRGGPTDWVEAFLAALQEPARRSELAARFTQAQGLGMERQFLFGALVYLGEYERALEFALNTVAEPGSISVEFLFSREAAGLRAQPAFGALVEAIGLDRHWDTYGWPASCRRIDGQIACSS